MEKLHATNANFFIPLCVQFTLSLFLSFGTQNEFMRQKYKNSLYICQCLSARAHITYQKRNYSKIYRFAAILSALRKLYKMEKSVRGGRFHFVIKLHSAFQAAAAATTMYREKKFSFISSKI